MTWNTATGAGSQNEIRACPAPTPFLADGRALIDRGALGRLAHACLALRAILAFLCCLREIALLPSAPMAAPQLEHRGKRRVRTKVRATVRTNSQSVLAETRDISTGGMFLYANGSFEVGSEIQIVLMLPRELGLVMDRMVCCHATVLRIEPPSPDGRHGIAATIDRFAMMNQV